MTSSELYRHLRGGLGAWFRGEGFKRAQHAQLGWQRSNVLVWFQCNKWGWDRYAGSSFFVNFQSGGRPEPWGGPMERLQHFLRDDELERVRSLQNGVVEKLSPPPREHVEALRAGFARTAKDPDGLIGALLQEFQPVEEPYRSHQDFALRYFEPVDVETWCSFLLGVLPRIVEQVQSESLGLHSTDGARPETEARN